MGWGSKVVAVLRFTAPALAGLAFGALVGVVLGLIFIGDIVARGGLSHAGHAGVVVLALLAFPPAIAGIVGANAGYIAALFVECVVVFARRGGASAPRRVAKLAMLAASIGVVVAFRVAAKRDADDIVLLLADFVLAGGGLVPTSLAAGGIAALCARALRDSW